jgi:hypothetical protein
MNVREGIFAKEMEVELGKEKSRKGGVGPLARGTSIKPTLSQSLQRSIGAIAAQVGLGPIFPESSRKYPLQRNTLQQTTHA